MKKLTIDIEEHNKRVLSYPKYQFGMEAPMIMPEVLVKMLISKGLWDIYKDYVVISPRILCVSKDYLKGVEFKTVVNK